MTRRRQRPPLMKSKWQSKEFNLQSKNSVRQFAHKNNFLRTTRLKFAQKLRTLAKNN